MKQLVQPSTEVRARRAYFDCRFGQLHVRTSFPGTGGFDERPTVFCVHSQSTASRVFTRLLQHMAANRSVYAADLPGAGESDASAEPAGDVNAAQALEDLARELRLNSFDVLALDDGVKAAVRLSSQTPSLVRRLVFLSRVSLQGMQALAQPALVIAASVGELDDEAQVRGIGEQAMRFFDR